MLNKGIRVVILVNVVLLNDSFTDNWIVSLWPSFFDFKFSRILSKITTVSFTEYPAIVNKDTANKLYTSTDNIIPNQENIPKTINKSWNKANNANNAYFLSNLKVIYKDIANKESHNETIQLSVNESFRRTTFTSITTLIPLLSIISFGSYSLFWFSLALTLGIIVGSYSSILLAPSLLLKDWA